MSKINPTYEVKRSGSMEMFRAMVGIGIACALLIVLTYEGTKPRIERLKAEAFEKAIFKVIPGTDYKATLMVDDNNVLSIDTLSTNPERSVYAGYDSLGNFVGIAIEASGQGFADILRIIYGYDPIEEQIIGFYVLESKETPGLGDKIEKDPRFLENFEALDVSLDDDGIIQNPIITVKQGAKVNHWEVDGITGATISSRAIGDILAASTEYWVPLLATNKENFINQNKEMNQE